MRSSFAAFLRGFTLPFGATSGRRIVFDGVNGIIQFYDASGALRIQLGGTLNPAAIILSSGDAEEDATGFIETNVFGAGGTRQARLNIVDPALLGSTLVPPRITFLGQSRDTTVLPRMLLTSTEVEISHPASSTIPSYAIPRGIIDQQPETTNDGPHSADAATDFALNNVPVIAGHTYALHLHTDLAFASVDVASRWVLRLRVNGSNEAVFEDCEPRVGGVTRRMVDATCYWVAPTTQATDDFTVFADEVAGAGADITLEASGTNPRWFTISDCGVL
jgi:hypothetical protein